MADSKVLASGDKRKPPAAGIGRKKGVPNKTTKAAKDAIALAAERLGGVDRLVDWVKEDPANERVFWGTVYPKLLPLQVSGEDGAPLTIQIVKFGESHGDDPASE
jgi:hypothetical protein